MVVDEGREGRKEGKVDGWMDGCCERMEHCCTLHDKQVESEGSGSGKSGAERRDPEERVCRVEWSGVEWAGQGGASMSSQVRVECG